jgi:hypothetical protein
MCTYYGILSDCINEVLVQPEKQDISVCALWYPPLMQNTPGLRNIDFLYISRQKSNSKVYPVACSYTSILYMQILIALSNCSLLAIADLDIQVSNVYESEAVDTAGLRRIVASSWAPGP